MKLLNFSTPRIAHNNHMHQHSLHEFHYVISGSGNVVFPEKKQKIVKGTFFYIAPGNMHMVIGAEPEMPVTQLVFCLETGEPDGIFYHEIMQGLKKKNFYYIGERHTLFFEIMRTDAESGNENLTRKACYNFIAFLYELLSESCNTRYSEHRENSIIEACLSFIHSNAGEKMQIKNIARHLKITPEYLSTLFKKNFGISPMNYIIKKKIDTALVYLADEKIKIYEAAEIAGFSDSYYFTRIFTRYMGMSPSAYRERKKGAGDTGSR